MKKYIYIFLLLSLVTNVLLAQRVIKGKIHCENRGVAKVVVTDGKNFATTNAKGYYNLFVDEKQNYLYYSLPKGYESPIKNGLPVFYKKITPESETYDFELKKAKLLQNKHTFVVWADPQIMEPEEFGLLEKIVDDIKVTKSTYDTYFHGISCGDMVFDRLNLLDDYKQTIRKMDFPFYQVIGNHDMDYSNQTHESSTQSYQKHFGPDYYSFNIGDVHYIMLNDVFYYGYAYHYMGYFDQRQLDWLKKDLSHIKKSSTVIIGLHIPTLYTDVDAHPNMEKRQKNSLINNKVFYECLNGYNVHILAGHSHTQWNTLISDSIIEHTHSAASAAWWQGEIGLDGTPKGYTIYEVDGNDVKSYFKGVGMTREEQLKIYPVGADVDHPTAFIVNVFNHDPLWKVQWYENDILKGDMEQFWGVDPLAKQLYQPGKNKKYSWLTYVWTNHLFKAIPTSTNSQIKVIVTDRFGRKYIRTISQKQ